MAQSKPRDLNRLASAVVAEATGQAPPPVEKNPAAVALGKLGGEARAAQFKTAKERRDQARKAANARWAAHREAKAKEA